MIQKSSIIPTEQLTLNDLPTVNSNWTEISKFALTFDPYENEQPDSAFSDEVVDIRILRMKLYVEQRRWNHYNQPPDTNTIGEIQDTIQKIKSLLH